MARRGGLFLPRWLRHRYLLAAEALLVMDVLLRLLEHLLVQTGWRPWVIVLIVMVLVVGLLGVVVLAMERLARSSVEAVHDLIRHLPLPIPLLVVHIVVFGGCFLAIAWDLGLLRRIW
ncbi:MAG: hypothetical protein ACOCXJ_03460 [Planctomycetota bacterium]